MRDNKVILVSQWSRDRATGQITDLFARHLLDVSASEELSDATYVDSTALATSNHSRFRRHAQQTRKKRYDCSHCSPSPWYDRVHRELGVCSTVDGER
jgi:hypothetical protein